MWRRFRRSPPWRANMMRCLIVDDAHATGILGEGGRGPIRRSRHRHRHVFEGARQFRRLCRLLGHHARLSRQSLRRLSSTRQRCRRRCLGAIDAALDLLPSWTRSAIAWRHCRRVSAATPTDLASIPAGRPRRSSPWSLARPMRRCASASLCARRGSGRQQFGRRPCLKARRASDASSRPRTGRGMWTAWRMRSEPRQSRCPRRHRISMHFVLVHGWGFNASIWTPLIAQLGNAQVTKSILVLSMVASATSIRTILVIAPTTRLWSGIRSACCGS